MVHLPSFTDASSIILSLRLMYHTTPLAAAVAAMCPLPSPRMSLNGEIVMGCPSRHCEGVGICQIIMRGEPLATCCPTVPARFSTHPVTGRLRMDIEKDTLLPAYRRRHFSGPQFRMEEAFIIPDRLVRSLGLPITRIEAGNYAVIETATGLRVEF